MHCRLKMWARFWETYWIVSEWCCWEPLCRKKQMERHQGAALRWRQRAKEKNRVDMKKSRQELRDVAQQNTSVHGTVPFLSHKSCTVHMVLSGIILPLENTSTCPICQPCPLWGRRSLCHPVLTQCGSAFTWIHSVIGTYSPRGFWQDCKGLLRFTARNPSNAGFKNEMRTGMGGINATDFNFLSLALSLTKRCQRHTVSLVCFSAPGTVAASYWEGEGCEVGAKAAFHSSQRSGCPQAFLQGGNRQDYACLLVSLVAKDYLQCKRDSSHHKQCAY